MNFTFEQYEHSAQVIRERLGGFVPKVAMSDWDFTRYGRTYLLPAREYNAVAIKGFMIDIRDLDNERRPLVF